MSFIYHFFHLEAVHEKFLQQVGQAQVRVSAGVDIATHEIAYFVFFERGRGVQINAAPGLEALPHLCSKVAIVWDVLNDAEDDDGVVRLGRVVLEEIFKEDLAVGQPLFGDEFLVQPVRVLGNGQGRGVDAARAGVAGNCAPARANVEQAVPCFQMQGLGHGGKFVFSGLF